MARTPLDNENLFDKGVGSSSQWVLFIEPGQEALYGHISNLLRNKSMLCVLIRIASSRLFL